MFCYALDLVPLDFTIVVFEKQKQTQCEDAPIADSLSICLEWLAVNGQAWDQQPGEQSTSPTRTAGPQELGLGLRWNIA